MVMAGMINEKMMGSREKKSLMSARPKIKKVEKKNHPVTMRNNDITIYAMGEMK
jgi:Cu/Ag efflux protein CusF